MRWLGQIRWLVATAVVGCGGGNALHGSIGESYDLDFDVVRIRGQNEALIIEFVKLVPGGENKALKIVVEGRLLVEENGARVMMASGLAIDRDLFFRAVTISRVSTTGAEFPAVEDGRMFFTSLELYATGRVEGNFDIVFENGRTMSGSFMGVLEVVDLS